MSVRDKTLRTIETFLLISMLFGPPAFAQGEGAPTRYDLNYFDHVHVSTSTMILSFLPPDDVDVNIAIYENPMEEPLRVCSRRDQQNAADLSLDCGLQPLSIGSRGYQFVLLDRQEDWYKIYLDPDTRTTTWVHPFGKYSSAAHIITLQEWLKQGDTFVLAPGKRQRLPVYKAPRETSPIVTHCPSFQIENFRGLVRNSWGARGEWFSVTCAERHCLKRESPESRSRCPQGWIRWILQGKLRVYPQQGLGISSHDDGPQAVPEKGQ